MRALPLRHALALGLLQGPTELLPVSSSAHTALVPWLAGWRYPELDAEQRKAFEVALHAGTAAALLLRPPTAARTTAAVRPQSEAAGPVRGTASAADQVGGARRPARVLAFLGPALAPPALAGYLFGRQVERRLGTPRTITAGLLGGSAAMLAGELHACAHDERATHDANARDGLAVGLAQALALAPGVSRSGACLAAARLRGFDTLSADRLSWSAGLPVILGATLLQGIRLARRGAPRELRVALAMGAVGAFLSTLLAAGALGARRRAALLPACAAYRAALATLLIWRMRDKTSSRQLFISEK